MANTDAVNRRDFLRTAAGSSVMLTSQLAGSSASAAATDEWPRLRPATLYKVYVGRSGERESRRVPGTMVRYLTWSKEEITKMENHLRDLEKKLGDVTFVGGEAIPPADVAEVAAKAESADGLLLIWLSGHGGDYETLEKLSFGLDKPAVSFFQPFSGHGWMWHQQWKDRNVVLLSTTDLDELDEAVGLLRVPALMKQTSPVFAMLAVSTLFAVVHFHLPAVLPLFIIAMACSIAYVRTGSILVPIIMHATFNATTLLSLLAQGNS